MAAIGRRNNSRSAVGSFFRAVMPVAAIALISCGGGGGTGTGTGTTIPSLTPLTTIAASPYTSGSAATALSAIYTNLSDVRVSMGVGALPANPSLDTAASAHAAYLATNMESGALQAATHAENSQLADYYAATPLDRARFAGLSTPDWVGEVTTVFGTQSDAGVGTTTANVCFRQFWDSVYHLAAITANQEIMGIGLSTQPAYTACVVLGAVVTGATQAGQPQANALPDGGGQQMSTGSIAVVPVANSTGVDIAFNAYAESPNPVPDLSTQLDSRMCVGASEGTAGCVGRPIMVRVNAAQGDTLLVNTFTLTDASGRNVSARIIVPSGALSGSGVNVTADVNSALSPGVAFLIPLQPLATQTNYTVNFLGTRDGSSIGARWSFTTGSS